ncbi:ankyrin repeat domain-containing protein [Marinobacter sp. TBZ242]|uniref:Ankyrin repeat domain-containing protein n=1 Tax=Marinobacter azerbaijanicus TaxID=3050455 RepID=A0ABT7I9X3_9GAMM|nr:ankyrin repeat domain-containing protein [Marinobacter sp. TBZ242]MDL0430956.1 ankyrin repeat domain-containing protein [Marinobacter sp. TBZ242]
MAQGTGTVLPRLLFILIASTLVTACATGGTPSNLEQRNSSVADTPLMAAVSSGNLDRVESLADAGASLNTLTEEGTPLAAAVAAGEDRIVWFLLSEGAAPDLATASGVTPLMLASGNGHRRIVQLLLSAGASVNASDREGTTPVIRAARNGHLSVVKVLLAAGANVNVSQGGRSLLMHIVDGGDLLTAEMLLAAGADVNYRGSTGETALDLARASNNRDIEMLLIQAGADI